MPTCPRCKLDLQTDEYESVDALFCRECWGHWLSIEAFTEILNSEKYEFNQEEKDSVLSSWAKEAPDETFDPIAAWGISHILPRIEDSGRWANIPICLPSLLQYQTGSTVEDSVSLKDDATTAPDPLEVHVQSPTPVRKHRMVSCLWASAGYRTRGERFAINDGQRRLIEWILYHQDVLGFEHVYLYDNSGAFTNETSLKPVADMFPDTVTYIGWPSQICNNRPNNRDR